MKAIVSVIGHDNRGIIAKVSNCLYEMNINIEDISQTIIQGQFTMIMIVSLDETEFSFKEIGAKLENIAKKANVDIKIQHENIFNCMHKI